MGPRPTCQDRCYEGPRMVRSWRLLAEGATEMPWVVRKSIVPFCETCCVVLGDGACSDCVMYEVLES